MGMLGGYVMGPGLDRPPSMAERDMTPVSFPRPEPGLCVDVSEDGSRILLSLDREHAKELATIIANLSVSRDGYDAWLEVVNTTADDTWLGAMLRLMACSQNIQRRA